MQKIWLGLAGAAALALVGGAAPAHATTTGPNFCLNSTGTDCQVQLDVGNPGVSAYPGPYVSGDVKIISPTELEFTFTGNTVVSGATTYKYFFGDLAFDLSVPAGGAIDHASFVSGTVGLSGAALTAAGVTFGGAISEDGFGSHAPGNKFGNVSVQTANGYPAALSSITFDVFYTGTNWTDLLSQQFMFLGDDGDNCVGNGCSAAGHVYVGTVTNGVVSSDAVSTGYAAWPNACDQRTTTDCPSINPLSVPEPASLALLGTGLIGLGWVDRRRRRRTA